MLEYINWDHAYTSVCNSLVEGHLAWPATSDEVSIGSGVAKSGGSLHPTEDGYR